VTDQDDEDGDEEEEDSEALLPAETDEKALEVELNAEARLDAADSRAAAVYEAGVWREIRGAHNASGPLRRLRKRWRAGAEAGVGEGVVPPMGFRTCNRRKNGQDGGWLPMGASERVGMLKSPDGVKVKSAAMMRTQI
jgi:hypothetical protein